MSDTTDATPTRVGSFRIESVLGRGGMGIVYAGVSDDGTPAAVKVIRMPTVDREDYLRRFEREAQIHVDHPNVVRILESGTDSRGDPFIAFERLVGESLHERLKRRGPLPPAEMVAIVGQACEGLAAAHAAGIVHRDLKPGNLFLCDDGTVKVLDFGIARVESAESDLTMGRVVGTPGYLSPEQAQGEPGVDGRADVWALGVVLYQALSGRRPFKGTSPMATLIQIILDDPPLLDLVTPSVPRDLANVVHRCLRKSPVDRYATAPALGEALAAADLTDRRAAEPPTRIEIDIDVDPEPATQSLRTSASAPSIAPDEQRIVAVVLARGVHDAGRFRRAIEGHAGTYIRLVGRSGLGVFGGTVWEGDEVERAAAAALAARPAVTSVAVASGRARSSGPSISGEVLELAEAGCHAALDGVAASRETAQVLGAAHEVREATGQVWEIRRKRDSYLPGAREGAILGRDAEVRELERVVEETLGAGTAGAVLVTGAAGIGKTRLRTELERLLDEREVPVRVFAARADARKQDTALSLVASALDRPTGHAPITETGSDATEIDRREGLLSLVRSSIGDPVRAEDCAQFLGELVGIPMPESVALAAARRDPQLMIDRLHLAVCDFFEAAAARGPLALIVEDLQWADEASIDTISALLDRLAFSPFLLLATARPEALDRFPSLWTDRGARHLPLQGLRLADVERLAALTSGAPVPRPLLEAIARRTDGNPLFVTEIVRALSEEDRLGGRPEDLPLPLTVEGAVQSRLDHLDGPEKELCKRAAIYARAFTAPELRAVGVGEPLLLLASLSRRELVTSRLQARGGEREFSFRTALLGDVAYRMIVDEQRRDLHRRAAEHLGAQPEPDPEEVARHHVLGDHPAAGALWYARAALVAERRGDIATVMRCSDRALELGAPPDRMYALRMARADALRFLGRRREQASELALALDLCGDEAERARALMESAVCDSRMGEHERALEVAAAAVEAARDGDPDLRAATLGRQANVLTLAGRLDEADRALRAAAECLDRASLPTRALVASAIGMHANALGDLGREMSAFRDAAALYEQAGDVRRAAGVEPSVADAYNRIGAYEDAEHALVATIDKCRRVGSRSGEGYALLNLAYARTGRGRFDEALAALDVARDLAEAISDVRIALAERVYRVRALLASGDAEPPRLREARAIAAAAAVEAERLSLPGLHAVALALDARALLRLGDVDAALEAAARADALLSALGATGEDDAEVFLVHADALDAAGRSGEAAEVRARGRAHLEATAARIGDRELRRRFLEDVPSRRALARAPDAGRGG